LVTQPGFQLEEERRGSLPAREQSLLSAEAIDLTLDLEQGVDAFDGL